MPLLGLTREQEGLLKEYWALLQESRVATRGYGWKNPADLWTRGIGYTLAGLSSLPLTPTGRGIDVGSGAGIVGIPAAILFPNLEVTCLESRSKKSDLLRGFVESLRIPNVRVVTERAEVLAHQPEHREQYHWAFARGLSRVGVANELMLPFLRTGGFALHFKTPSARREFLEAEAGLKVLGGAFRWVILCEGAGASVGPVLFIAQKRGVTPSKYPRKAGIPQKRPIGKRGAPNFSYNEGSGRSYSESKKKGSS